MENVNIDETKVGKFLELAIIHSLHHLTITKAKMYEYAEKVGINTSHIDTMSTLEMIIRGISINEWNRQEAEYQIDPRCFFNIIDLHELRHARKQALEAQKTSVEAQKIATHSLNWTIRGFVASVVFSIASILITIFNQNPISIDSKQNKVTIEPKQIDKIQEKMDNMSTQYQQQIEKLTKKLDSLQQKK